MNYTKIDESFCLVQGSPAELKEAWRTLSVQKPDANFDPLVKIGYKDPYVHFAEIDRERNGLKVLTGHLQALHLEYENTSAFSLDSLKSYLTSIIPELPFKPHDFQLRCLLESLRCSRKLALCCTGSGKSLIIALMLDYLTKQNLRCLLLVPNINLLTQFRNDIESYHLSDLLEEIEICGDGNKPNFEKRCVISTWQSMVRLMDQAQFDVCIADECHRIASDVASLVPISLGHCKYRFGFTGTMPEDPVLNFRMRGVFGEPERFIRASDLIRRGLGTPIEIRPVIFTYTGSALQELRDLPQWNQKLKFLKEYPERNDFITKLSLGLRAKGDNTLVLFSHTQHGKDLFKLLMAKLYPEVQVRDRDITGKKSFEFQEQYNIFFVNGEDDAKTRELTRVSLEDRTGCILVANYALLSTGVNIKRLNNLVFASPLKAYTTITQSIGRGIRKCTGKDVFRVYDLVDSTGVRKPTGVFYRQYQHRFSTSYVPEGYDIKEQLVTFHG